MIPISAWPQPLERMPKRKWKTSRSNGTSARTSFSRASCWFVRNGCAVNLRRSAVGTISRSIDVRMECGSCGLISTPFACMKDHVPRSRLSIVQMTLRWCFAAHEPTEHLNHRWVRPRYENDKRRFLKTLVTNYDSLLNDVTTAMAPYVEEYHARPPTVPHRVPRGGWRGLLEMVGIRQSRKQSDDDPATCDVDAGSDRGRGRS